MIRLGEWFYTDDTKGFKSRRFGGFVALTVLILFYILRFNAGCVVVLLMVLLIRSVSYFYNVCGFPKTVSSF